MISERLGDHAIEVWIELRENHHHRFRGPGRVELQRRFSRAILPQAIDDDGWDFGGDTAVSSSERGHTLWQLLEEKFAPTDCILIVGHGGCFSYFFHALLHLPPAAPYWFQMANCAISAIRLIPESERKPNPIYPMLGSIVQVVNDTAHLGQEKSEGYW